MSTDFCRKCQVSHPGRVCDYDDQGECAETSEAAPDLTEQPVTKDVHPGPPPKRDAH